MYQLYHTLTSPLLFTFIDSIEVKLRNAEYREINKLFYFNGTIQSADVIVALNKGTYLFGRQNISVQPGSFLFIPRGQQLNAGTENPFNLSPVTLESFAKERETQEYTRSITAVDGEKSAELLISYVAFDTILYNAFPFFPLLELPAFIIPPQEDFAQLIRKLCNEGEQDNLGRELMLKSYLGELIVHLFRHIDSNPEFQEAIEKLHYLTDVRLINIVKYIQENLEKDLTNAAIAKVAYVSDDYVGQFFKALTGRTLQDYIENQRLDRAMHLLKTIPNSVQEVAAMVGFRDPAYFSRRFRLRFNINANLVRQGKIQET